MSEYATANHFHAYVCIENMPWQYFTQANGEFEHIHRGQGEYPDCKWFSMIHEGQIKMLNVSRDGGFESYLVILPSKGTSKQKKPFDML